MQVTTFTDCVNCLIAFTNNRHNRTKDGLTVSLNAIAFLRFCAMKLAAGAIGDVETFPEGHPQTPTSQVSPPLHLLPRTACLTCLGDQRRLSWRPPCPAQPWLACRR